MKNLIIITCVCVLFSLLTACEEEYTDSDGIGFPKPTELNKYVGYYEVNCSGLISSNGSNSTSNVRVMKYYPGNDYVLLNIYDYDFEFKYLQNGRKAILKWDSVSDKFYIDNCDFGLYYTRNGTLSINGDGISYSYDIWINNYSIPDEFETTCECSGKKVKYE